MTVAANETIMIYQEEVDILNITNIKLCNQE